jgi:hypothetical protein
MTEVLDESEKRKYQIALKSLEDLRSYADRPWEVEQFDRIIGLFKKPSKPESGQRNLRSCKFLF